MRHKREFSSAGHSNNRGDVMEHKQVQVDT